VTDASSKPNAAQPAHKPRVAIVQDGARLRYAVPVALQRQQCLARVLTEYYYTNRPLSRALIGLLRLLGPGLARQLTARRHPEIDPKKTRDQPLRFLYLKQFVKQTGSKAQLWDRWRDTLYKGYARHGFGDANVLHGFVRNIAPDLASLARRRGLLASADQIIAPAAVEHAEDQLQHQRWPDYEPGGPRTDYGDIEALEQRTWQNLDLLTCASDYVRQGLIAQGLGPENVHVLPYPVDVDQFDFFDRANRPAPITVGFVGAVGLRKGAPYFIEVAKRLASPNLRFVMLGPLKLSTTAVQDARHAVELPGPVPLAEVPDWLRRFDMIYFPTTCEGSAGALVEAMATGLPVVTSPNSGAVARDRREGFICPYDDLETAARRIEQLASDHELRLDIGRAARQRIAEFNLDSYGARLRNLFQQALADTHAAQGPRP